MKQLGSEWKNFIKFDIGAFFENLSRKVNLRQNLTKDNVRALYMKTDVHLWLYLVRFFLELKIFHTKAVGKMKTHISFSITFFFSKSCCLWDNVKKYCRVWQTTDDNMAHAHCKLDNQGYRHTLTISNTYCFPLQQWLHKRASALHYTYIVCIISLLLTNGCTTDLLWRILKFTLKFTLM
jgi:hypothetical protein